MLAFLRHNLLQLLNLLHALQVNQAVICTVVAHSCHVFGWKLKVCATVVNVARLDALSCCATAKHDWPRS